MQAIMVALLKKAICLSMWLCQKKRRSALRICQPLKNIIANNLFLRLSLSENMLFIFKAFYWMYFFTKSTHLKKVLKRRSFSPFYDRKSQELLQIFFSIFTLTFLRKNHKEKQIHHASICLPGCHFFSFSVSQSVSSHSLAPGHHLHSPP